MAQVSPVYIPGRKALRPRSGLVTPHARRLFGPEVLQNPEILLIEKYHPLWNVVVDGFCNKNVGDRRRQMAKSVWDELHPGRPTAAAGPCRLSHVQILDRIRKHFSESTPIDDESRDECAMMPPTDAPIVPFWSGRVP